MTKEQLVNSVSSMMNLGRFELRLLHFFDQFCVPLFSFGVNKTSERMWRTFVPPLFVRSPLVRKAMFSFACMNMWPLCDVSTLFLADVQEARELYQIAPSWQDHDVRDTTPVHLFEQPLAVASTDNLYRRTLDYFSESISESQKTLSLGIDTFVDDPIRTAEMGIAGILIYSFLGLHPHKLVPILSFQLEDETDSQHEGPSTDFVAICRGIQSTFELGMNAILQTNLRTIYNTVEKVPPFIKEHKFPIMVRLHNELDQFYADYTDVIDPRINAEIETLRESIDILATSFYYSAKLNYPVPLFKWAIYIPEFLDVLLREKHFFALRLYYHFACICVVSRFSLYHHRNMWKDYMEWWRNYNMKLYGGWFYDYDRSFYDLIMDKNYKFEFDGFKFLYQFDPELLVNEL
ncbi:hypothetical protein JA9_003750 [Meyerozyma sp. JA9]|nr:hypothetical protein JA9_003750 [Meyerozyma sp. JA9]